MRFTFTEPAPLLASGKIQCAVCNASVKGSQLREHMGVHQLAGQLDGKEAPCGFCGGEGCEPSISLSKDKIVQVKVTCQRGCFVRFSYASTTKDGKKCTNTPMRCTAEGCDAVIWKYNMCAHWRSAHGGKPAPLSLPLI